MENNLDIIDQNYIYNGVFYFTVDSSLKVFY